MFLRLIFSFLVSFVFFMVAMSVHEFAHAWVAYKLGDRDIKRTKRLTLNPFSHIHFLWTFILPLILFVSSEGKFMFGVAKPVPINLFSLRNPKKDIFWVGLAGPLSNIVFAVILSIILKHTYNRLLISLIENLIIVNIVLAIFNLIPVPPLDGSRLLMGILPSKWFVYYTLLEPLGFMVLIFLSLSGILSLIIFPLLSLILRLLGVSI